MFNGEIRNRNVFMKLSGFCRHGMSLASGESACNFKFIPPPMKAESPAMPLSPQPSAKILIVEDDELDADLLRETLTGAAPLPLELTVARQVSDAIRLLNESRFDVVLSDLSLSDSQGLETFTRLSARAPETPIILLTGFEDESLGLEAVRAGAQEYIVKGTMNGKTLWRGNVEVYDLTGHPKAKHCYGWTYGDPEQFITILELPPVDSAEAAVKVGVAYQVKQAQKRKK